MSRIFQPWRHFSSITTLGETGPNVKHHSMLLRDESYALIEGHLATFSERIILVSIFPFLLQKLAGSNIKCSSTRLDFLILLIT